MLELNLRESQHAVGYMDVALRLNLNVSASSSKCPRRAERRVSMASICSTISRLRVLAPTLNQAADDAAQKIQEVENLLTKELAIGIKAEHTYSRQQQGPNEVLVKSLCYRRVGGKFRITVVESTEIEYGYTRAPDLAKVETAVTPWDQCSRDVKLESFEALPGLLVKVIETADKAMYDVERTRENVMGMLA